MAEVYINWDFNDPKQGDMVEVYRSESSSVDTVSTNRVTVQMVTSRRYIDRGLSIGNTYYYKMVLVRSGANIETRTMRVKINEPTMPPNPVILSVDDNGIIKTNTVSEIGTHLETDWVIDGDLVSDISLKNTKDLKRFKMDLGVEDGTFNVNVRVRYKGDIKSTDWSSPFEKEIIYEAEYDDGTFDAAEFLGEVPTRNLITGDALATHLNLTAGTAQHSNEAWLKFDLDGEIVYIAKKPYRYGLHWEHIYQAGAVYGTDDNGLNPSGSPVTQDARVNISGKEYRITLAKGAADNPTPIESGHDNVFTHDSEWNRMMYGIHSGSHSDPRNPVPPNFVSTPYNIYANYSDADLLVYFINGNGSYSWMQETVGGGSSDRLYRGAYGVTYADRLNTTRISEYYGWRPVLREIP